MMIRKLSYCCGIILACYLYPSCSHADGMWLSTPYSDAHTYSQTTSANRTIGPVTSMANAYGPVPAFGLRNYTRSGQTGLNYRRRDSDTYPRNYRRDSTTRKRPVQHYQNIFGYTYTPSTE